jgi:hypothetical protein
LASVPTLGRWLSRPADGLVRLRGDRARSSAGRAGGAPTARGGALPARAERSLAFRRAALPYARDSHGAVDAGGLRRCSDAITSRFPACLRQSRRGGGGGSAQRGLGLGRLFLERLTHGGQQGAAAGGATAEAGRRARVPAKGPAPFTLLLCTLGIREPHTCPTSRPARVASSLACICSEEARDLDAPGPPLGAPRFAKASARRRF